MDSTLLNSKYKKPNLEYVVIGKRDKHLFKTIWEQKFLTRDHVINHVFEGSKSYADIRIRKLKRFGYLKAVKTLAGERECYLLGPPAVDELRKICPAGIRGWKCAGIQDDIEVATYLHDKMVTDVRFLFEDLKLCSDWISEKLLKAGVRGEQKTPDGFFTISGKGIAVELERREKKASTYKKIIDTYERNPKIQYVFYVCENLSLMQKIMRLAAQHRSEKLCFVTYKELMGSRDEAVFWNYEDHFKLSEIF